MRTSRRRRSAVLATLGLLCGLVPVLLAVSPASAGSQPTTNACLSNATATYSDLVWTLAGEGAPDPATLGAGDVTLGGSTLGVNIPATLLIAGYNLGLLTVGANNIPTTVYVARTATNVNTPGGTETQVDNFTITAVTTITDPNGIPGTGDETATPLAVSEPLPNMVVTPTGGNVTFGQAAPGAIGSVPLGTGGAALAVAGSLFAQASVAGGLIKANFDCSPGTTIINPPGGTSGTTFTPAAVVPFETVTVTAPPTAPVCTDESLSVGAGQTATVDLTNNCSDVNGNIDPTTFAVSALTPASPAGGTLTPTATPGVYDYVAPAADPGPITFTFTVQDLTGLTSNTATGTISVLANQCDATSAACSLTEIVVQPVVGTTMTFAKAPGQVLMSTVVLNGAPQVSTGAIQPVVVTNARGTAAAWNVTGYVTDIGIAGLTPTFSPLPGVVVPACSAAGSFGLVTTPNRHCIPGDNLGWDPSAQITHDRIAGDVAHVTAGVEHAGSASAWLTALVTAGAGAPPSATPPSTVPGPNGLGGLQEQNNLCGAPVDQSGGTFQCDAALYLGVPASASAGIYTGGLVLTLL